MNTVTLYRPTGLKEFLLIAASGFKRFPPRLTWQPIFYPVMNQPYAEQIALDWNTKDEGSGFCGIVTRFDITETLFRQYEVQNVGGEIHNELWVPAEELEAFNGDIRGGIGIVKVFLGQGYVPPADTELAKMLEELAVR